MKPRTYFKLALLIPYLLWCICALIVFILSQLAITSNWSTVWMPVFYYAFGILIWFVPYTLLAISMWFWSKNKSKASLHKAAMIAPLLLIVLMLIETTLVSLPFEHIEDFAGTMLGQILLTGGFSLVFGYLCVGIALGSYKILQTRGFVQEEASSPFPKS